MLRTNNNISLIKKFIEFQDFMCEQYHNNCEECPLYESSDGWKNDVGIYEYVDNCKYDFGCTYVEDILNAMDTYEQNASLI